MSLENESRVFAAMMTAHPAYFFLRFDELAFGDFYLDNPHEVVAK
jgi:hypothetical protein